LTLCRGAKLSFDEEEQVDNEAVDPTKIVDACQLRAKPAK
jgi:hypothetical protein